MDESPKRKRGNPNFLKGNRFGIALPKAIVEGKETERISTGLLLSVKAKFDALPSSSSQKLCQAVDLLLQNHQSEDMPNTDTNATDFCALVKENNLLVLATSVQTLSTAQWQQVLYDERQECIDSFNFDTTQSKSKLFLVRSRSL